VSLKEKKTSEYFIFKTIPKYLYFISGDELNLEPIGGDLEPGQFIEIKLSLVCSIFPSVYEGEIECVILWDREEKKGYLFNI
jgi:hypothetical protein